MEIGTSIEIPMLMEQNRNLVAKVNEMKDVVTRLEQRIRALTSNQESYDQTLAFINSAWNQVSIFPCTYVDSMLLLLIGSAQ